MSNEKNGQSNENSTNQGSNQNTQPNENEKPDENVKAPEMEVYSEDYKPSKSEKNNNSKD